MTSSFWRGDLGGGGQWPGQPRDPLPPFPQATGNAQPPPPQVGCWSSKGDYIKTPPKNVPMKPDLVFHRGNFYMRFPGFTGGVYDGDRSYAPTWDGPKWSADDQRKNLDWYANGCSYTHWDLSLPQSMLNQKLPFLALSDFAQLAKSEYGQFVACQILGGDFSWRLEWSERKGYVQQLIDAKLLDVGVLCWQMDIWYQPIDIVESAMEISQWLQDRGVPMVIHWGGYWTQNCAAWDDETAAKYGINSRASFQSVLLPKGLKGHYAQLDVNAPIDELQSALNKILIAMPPPMFLVASEQEADGIAHDFRRTEAYGDLKGLLCTYASPDGRISAFNGYRQPDGSMLPKGA